MHVSYGLTQLMPYLFNFFFSNGDDGDELIILLQWVSTCFTADIEGSQGGGLLVRV